MNAEHAHLLLVHLPIIGLLAALVPLAWGVLRNDRTATALGLVLAALFALTTPLAVATGDEAEGHLEHALGPTALDAQGLEWMETHEERAERGAIVLYVAAAAFMIGLGVVLKWDAPGLTRGIGAGALALCVVSLGAMVWVADAGGKIRHPELRQGAQVPAGPVRDEHVRDEH